jgi:hypothetical protein
MKALLFKPTMLVMVIVCLMNSIQSNYFNSAPSEMTLAGGHIEVVGDFLIGDTQDPSIVIEDVTLSGSQNYTFVGCNKKSCSYDVSSMNSGNYEVTLFGTNGYIFTAVVTIR